MEFKVDPKIFELFPDLHIGLVLAKGIDNSGTNEEILNQIRNQENIIKSNFKTEELSENPKIASWRKAYSGFGAKPKKYKCSVENLYRMILNGIELKHINKAVDIYNLVSIKNLVPVGGDDLDKIDGNIILTVADGSEPFIELNSDEINHPKSGEIIYRDDREVLCRRWNWRECNKSRMTEETKNILLVAESLPPVTKSETQEVIYQLKKYIEKYCKGDNSNVAAMILDKENPEFTFSCR